jgi:hypothetical protein
MIPLVVANEPGKAQILNLVSCNRHSNCSFVIQIQWSKRKDKSDGNQRQRG